MSSLLRFAIFSLCVVIAIGKAARTNQLDRIWKNKKLSCEVNQCTHLFPDEAYNCVNDCISTDCFNSIYHMSPLEDGEVDDARQREFMTCVRKESRK